MAVPPFKPNVPPPPAPPSAVSPRPPSFGGGLLVSLMPTEGGERRGPSAAQSFVIAGVIVLVEILLIGGAYFFLTRSATLRQAENDALQAKILDLEKKIDAGGPVIAEAALLKKQARALAFALDNHVDWRKVLRFLEDNATPTIRFLNFNGDIETGIVSVDALGVSYKDIADQIVLLRDHPMVTSVKSSSAASVIDSTGVITGVAASITVKFKPELVSSAEPSATGADIAP